MTTRQSAAESVHGQRTTWIVAGVCALAAILAFANTLGHAFVYDDAILLGEPRVQSLARWREILTLPFFRSPANDIDVWRPLASFGFALDFTISRWLGDGAPDPRVFHASNVAWHAVASALAGVCALRLGLPRVAAIVAGLVFAVHPIHVEVVANVYQRQESMAVAFGLAFLLAHRAGRLVWSAAFFLLAVASKESAIGFLPLVLAVDALLPDGTARFRPRSWIGPAIALAVYLAARAHALEGVQARPMPIENPIATVGAVERVATALRVQLLYLQLIVWPAGYSSDYSFDQIQVVTSLLRGRVLAFLGIVAAALWAAWRWRTSRPRVAIAVVAWASLFAVTSNLLFPIGTIAAERLAYAPLFAAALLAGELVAFASERGRARLAAACAGVALLVLALVTVRQNRVWKDTLTLFRDQVATAPHSAKAHANLGLELHRAGDDASAVEEIETSLGIYATNSHAWYTLGVSLYNLRAEPARVVGAFENALRIGPMHHDARVKLVLVLLRLRGFDEAQREIETLARLAPDHPQLADLRARLAAARK